MGIVVAIEGMEGAGKTAVVTGVAKALGDSHINSAVVPEFSDSPLGAYLSSRLLKDRFLRDPDRPRTAWTQIYSVAADTAYALEHSVVDLRSSHEVVLKDRYRESLVACQHVVLADEYGLTDTAAHDLLVGIAGNLPHVADLVIWLDVPAAVRYRRMRERGDFIDGDEQLLRRRERSYERLLASSTWPRPGLTVNGAASLTDVITMVAGQIIDRLPG
jgi:thymidylate kinase